MNLNWAPIYMLSAYKKMNFMGEKTSLRNRLLRGFSWSVGSAILSKIILLFVSFYIARELGRTMYGEFALLQNTINTCAMLAGLGVSVSATKYIAQYREHDKAKASRILSLNVFVALLTSIILAVCVFTFSDGLASQMLNNGDLSAFLQVGSGAIFFSTLNGAVLGALAGFEKFKDIAFTTTIGALVTAVLQVLLVIHFGIMGLVIAMVISQLIMLCFGGFWLLQSMQYSGILFVRFGLGAEMSSLVKFNLPSILGSVMVAPTMWVSQLFLVNQIGGYAEMGIFAAANQWRNALIFLPMALNKVVLSLLSNLSAQQSSRNFKQVFYINLAANLVGGLLVLAFVSVFAELIFSGYGVEFVGYGHVLIIMVVVACLTSANAVVGNVFASLDKMWTGFLLNALWGGQLLVYSYFLCPLYGAMGLALAFLIAYVIHSICQVICVRRYFNEVDEQ